MPIVSVVLQRVYNRRKQICKDIAIWWKTKKVRTEARYVYTGPQAHVSNDCQYLVLRYWWSNWPSLIALFQLFPPSAVLNYFPCEFSFEVLWWFQEACENFVVASFLPSSYPSSPFLCLYKGKCVKKKKKEGRVMSGFD